MNRWIRSTKDPDWARLFTSYTRTAYRLEGQQMYSSPVEDEHLATFLSGRPVEFDLTWRLSKTRAQAAIGRTKMTVRIVIEPPTAYTRLELTIYPRMVEAGEEIRIIAVPQGERPCELPRHDYWLFDDHDVWRMHYHENFRFAGAELLDDSDAIAEHLHWRDLALARSVPLDEYLASREPTPEPQERTTA
jgi:hypothetical protein